MTKHLSYYMSREEFKLLAAEAVAAGCLIVPAVTEPFPVTPSTDPDAFQPDSPHFIFWLPELGELRWKERIGLHDVDGDACGQAIIHAGFSIRREEDSLSHAYITACGLWLKTRHFHRPSRRLLAVYDRLARKVAEIAPPLEITNPRTGKTLPFHVSADCRAWRAEGYEIKDVADEPGGAIYKDWGP